ncbi:uncharacterized protein LOC128530750 [Clarias gariepinus]|uniref:uncharacterized protein LOC128530750 n=1 Tax=Clarias gariepinus TaxID=13013 RepID=UPI00234DA090|nr:uncharacterized protein LOC128530750 [Clarias gariepinus]
MLIFSNCLPGQTKGWILMLVLHCWTGLSQHVPIIPADCNKNIILPCSVSDPGRGYRYIVWYRNDTAIIKRKNVEVTFYNKSSPASLGVHDTLVLLNVQPSDSGYYHCFLAAEVGQKDRQSYVGLTVSECVTVSPTRTTFEEECTHKQVEVSVLWLLLGFSLFSMIKIIFCIITVIGCKRQRGSEARHRSGKQRNNSCKQRKKRQF